MMSANSHAYDTVFTVNSLPVHGKMWSAWKFVRALFNRATRQNFYRKAHGFLTKPDIPLFNRRCSFFNHSDKPVTHAYLSNTLKIFTSNEDLVIGQPTHSSKMKLGKTHRIAYIWHTMHDAIKDEQLMLQYKDGDSRAFEILYSRYRLPMFRYLQNQCGNAAIAEEIFQDVWMNLVRARERYQVTASFKTYIYRLAHNRLIDHYRKQKHGVPSSYDEHEGLLNMEATANQISPQRHVAVAQQVDKLLEAIAQLPEAQREAFLLKEETGLTVEEIATMTDVKPETAKSRIRYAMNKLKEAVEIEHYA